VKDTCQAAELTLVRVTRVRGSVRRPVDTTDTWSYIRARLVLGQERKIRPEWSPVGGFLVARLEFLEGASAGALASSWLGR